MKKWRINRPDPVKTAEFMNKCDLKSLTLDVMTSRAVSYTHLTLPTKRIV